MSLAIYPHVKACLATEHQEHAHAITLALMSEQRNNTQSIIDLVRPANSAFFRARMAIFLEHVIHQKFSWSTQKIEDKRKHQRALDDQVLVKYDADFLLRQAELALNGVPYDDIATTPSIAELTAAAEPMAITALEVQGVFARTRRPATREE